jgi:hypothetical protein
VQREIPGAVPLDHTFSTRPRDGQMYESSLSGLGPWDKSQTRRFTQDGVL